MYANKPNFFLYLKIIKNSTLRNLGIIERTYGSFPNSIPQKYIIALSEYHLFI